VGEAKLVRIVGKGRVLKKVVLSQLEKKGGGKWIIGTGRRVGVAESYSG